MYNEQPQDLKKWLLDRGARRKVRFRLVIRHFWFRPFIFDRRGGGGQGGGHFLEMVVKASLTLIQNLELSDYNHCYDCVQNQPL